MHIWAQYIQPRSNLCTDSQSCGCLGLNECCKSTLVACTLFMHFSETDQICCRADCEKSNNQIFSSLVSNKFSWISASFKLWYMIVSLLVMELFKKKDRPVSNNHPVVGTPHFHNTPHNASRLILLVSSKWPNSFVSYEEHVTWLSG